MSWNYYEKTDEKAFCTVLPNGLTVKVIPKPGFTKSLAYFVTDFGSIHRQFELDGEVCHTPSGVAHFLEHKMFELPNRDVSAEFAALGGNVRFTDSHNCIVNTRGMKDVVVIGVNDCIVAENEGNLLVCKMSEENRIKEFSEEK